VDLPGKKGRRKLLTPGREKSAIAGQITFNVGVTEGKSLLDLRKNATGGGGWLLYKVNKKGEERVVSKALQSLKKA